MFHSGYGLGWWFGILEDHFLTGMRIQAAVENHLSLSTGADMITVGIPLPGLASLLGHFVSCLHLSSRDFNTDEWSQV